MDHQVKVSGYRIELGEIAAVLERHPAVAEAVVLATPDLTGELCLNAYLVPTHGTTPTVSELRAAVQGELPSYMTPARFHFLDRMPLTPNGKVNRQALVAREENGAPLGVEYVEPENTLERELRRIWQEVLGQERVGVLDNFFDLGGNSLALARVHTRAQGALEREFPLVDCLKFPTIRNLALHLTNGANEKPDDGLDDADRRAQLRRQTLKLMRP
jgi:hypothetical protein